MNEREMHDVMMYLFADLDMVIRPEKRQVWLKQFGHLDIGTGMAAADLLLTRKMFGPPRVFDFASAVAEVTATADDVLPWGDAWNLIMTAVSRFGSYRVDDAVKSLPPNVAQALGSDAGFRELCMSDSETLPTQRAQFRQRYEALATQSHNSRTMNPKLRETLEANRNGKALLDSTLAILGNKNEH